ncbi:MAG TPA: hypothetical protein VJJ47_03925 [Candidatus Paceibacterota bacterium]
MATTIRVGRRGAAVIALLRYATSQSGSYNVLNIRAMRRLKAELGALTIPGLKSVVYRLSRQGLVTVDHEFEGIGLTEKGRRIATARESCTRSLPTVSRENWDGCWRIVCFDVPERMRGKRMLLSSQLRALGMLRVQRSVFVHPGECRAEVSAIADAIGVRGQIFFATAVASSNDERLTRKFFG